MSSTKWQKGKSGNPGGRPRVPDDLKKSCRRLALVGMKRIEDILRDKNADRREVIAATKLCMEYGYGKPVQPIGGDVEGGNIVVHVLTLTEPEEGAS